MTRPRISGLDPSCSKAFEFEMNPVLAAPNGSITIISTTSEGATPASTTIAPNARTDATRTRGLARRPAMASPPITAPVPISEKRTPYAPAPAWKTNWVMSGMRIEKL